MALAKTVASIVLSALSAVSAFATNSNHVSAVKVAICQIFVIDSDREGNFRRIEFALADAKTQGAQIAAFPESAILGWENPVAHRLAEPIPGPDSRRIQELAKKFDLMIAIGLDEKDGDRLYDSAILVDHTGKILWKHRKINVLPELMTPPYSQGKAEDIAVVETEFGRIAFLICADTFSDVHFDRIKALKPDFMIVPYGWAAKPEEWPEHAKELEKIVSLRARELGCEVVGTDLVGVMSAGPWKGYTYGGASVAVSARGEVISKLRDRDAEVKVVEIHPRGQ
jgi:predicted amidohydrolase